MARLSASEVQECWKVISEWFERNFPAYFRSLNPGATEQQIAEFERSIGVRNLSSFNLTNCYKDNGNGVAMEIKNPQFNGITPSIGEKFELPVLYSKEFPDRVDVHQRTYQGGWVLSLFDKHDWGREIIIIDDKLAEVDRINLPQPVDSPPCLALSPDGQLLAFTTEDGVYIYDRQGQQRYVINHEPWEGSEGSNCIFTPNGLLWFVRPDQAKVYEDDLSYDFAYHKYCFVTAFDCTRGQIQSELQIPNSFVNYRISQLPLKSALFINNMDIDGDGLFLVNIDDSGPLSESFIDIEDIFLTASANGEEFYCSNNGDSDQYYIRKFKFPHKEPIGSLEETTAFANDAPEILMSLNGEGDRFSDGFLLNDQRMLVKTSFGRLLLIDTTNMSVIGTIWPASYQLHSLDYLNRPVKDPDKADYWGGEIWSIHPGREGQVLIVNGGNTLQLIDLHSLLGKPD